jgi:hypothetical protein
MLVNCGSPRHGVVYFGSFENPFSLGTGAKIWDPEKPHPPVLEDTGG